MDIMRKRTTIPRVVNVNNEDRLIILPGEDAEITTSSGTLQIKIIYNSALYDFIPDDGIFAGRPIGREYFDVDYKLR